MLNVVFASDNNYAPLLGVAITSLIKNNQNDFDKINIFILDDGITEENKKKIGQTITNPNHVLNYIKTKNLEDIGAKLMGLDRNSNMNSFTVYSRLFINSLLPKDIDKVIYLDCDALIVGSFKELWDTNINEYYCGAVLDVIGDMTKYLFGFKLEDNFINSGFLLINLKKWREENVEEKFINFMVENQNRFYQHDQGILNNVFKNQFLILNPKYNLIGYFQTLDYNLTRKYSAISGEYYSKEIVNQAKENPIFLHFTGLNRDRPWYNKYHPYRDLYIEYSEISGFKNEIIEEEYEIPFTSKLFYKSRNNPFIRLFMKIIPTSLIYKRVNKAMVDYFDEENKKINKQK